ncbi:Endoribonuclease YbeY [Roseivivax sp. THAF40]|uniref:rRNA maturation RNase YbeY n=1 Tax=unclassified Roseivivax TaxID=2639302 RepID=UPI00126871BA|nr:MULTISPECIES: rRNA maturation RNase YbeY [unclassified Roseivivax]QFS81681.1 Endoribonuclease YbeY [Roseivivax sp. THAF197b]QFT45473.1 Endoribonuclease YbeY [Roseivivax sp. THAF40]
MLTETILEDEGWAALNLSERAEAAARGALAALDLDPDAFEIAVLGCNDARIATLNADFRGKPQPTNVLSWPEEDLAAEEPGGEPERPVPQDAEPHFLGDIAIARETCLREAREQRLSADHHVTHLIVHGVLHLLGYDHVRDEDATLMERLEARILGNMGIADPYVERPIHDATN